MLINYEAGTLGYLDLTFGPKWDYIPLTRVYVENFLQVNMTGKQNIHKIEMAASELLENAVKYSNKDGIRMIVMKNDSTNQIELSVFNFISEENAEKVKSRIEEMNQADPFEYYVARMRKSVKEKKKGSAGLGLARIAYEGGAQISVNHIKDENVMQVKLLFDLQ